MPITEAVRPALREIPQRLRGTRRPETGTDGCQRAAVEIAC